MDVRPKARGAPVWWIPVAVALLLAPPGRLGHAGPETPDPHRDLRAVSPRKRLEAAWKLADVRTADARAAWTSVLRDPQRAELHFEAAARLADFEGLDTDARKALETALDGQDRAVRLAAAVALRRTADHAGPLDFAHAKRPGEAFLGAPPGRGPVEGAPSAFAAATLDRTLWIEQGPINILGEGAITYVSMLRVGDDVVARTARAARRLVRAAPGAGGKRTWTTDWVLGTGWIDVAARAWVGARAGAEVGAGPVSAERAVGVGLVRGRLALPALVRKTLDRWSYVGPRDVSTFRFRGALLVGKEGTVEITIEAAVGARVAGNANWRITQGSDGPVLRIDASMAIAGGLRSIRPHEFLLDTGTGAAAAVLPRSEASASYLFAGRMPPHAKAD